jgi:hypothetical protein
MSASRSDLWYRAEFEYVKSFVRGTWTYGEIEHAGLLRGAEVLALSDFGVCVKLFERVC